MWRERRMGAGDGRGAAGGRTRGGVISSVVRADLRSRLIPLPSMLQIEVSSLCNLRCAMCAKTHGYQGTPPDRVMEWETFRRVERILPVLDYVDLSGVWGEAFIRPDLYLAILSELKRHGIFVRTISNGTLITPAIARSLVEKGLDLLAISVDAARPETYRKWRKGGELGAVLGAARAVRDEKRRQERDRPRVEFMFLGMVDTIGELPELVEIAADLGVSRVVLQEMAEYETTRGQSLAWRDRELGRRVYGEAAKAAEALGVELALQPCDQFEEPAEKEVFKEADGPRRAGLLKDCFLPWKMAVLTTAGDVIPCCAMFTSMGNVRKERFEDIWRGKRFRALRRANV